MATESYFGQCKCCLKETFLKHMWYTGKEQEEVYGQMIVDCFAVDWMVHGNIQDDKICEACISKLHVAVNFKNQVLMSQERCLENSKKDKDASQEEVEEESVEEQGECLNVNGAPKNYEDVEFLEEEVLDEVTNEDDSQDSEPVQKKPKWPKKRSLYERFKLHRQYTEENLESAVEAVRAKEMSIVKAAETYKIPRNSISKKLYEDTDGDHGIDQLPEENLDSILRKHRDNVQSILVASNATPLKGHWGFGYACYFCPQQFAEPSQLKQHTFTHGSLIKNVKVKSITEHIIKLDVTKLKCNVCDINIGTLEYLMVHLKEQHGMLIHLDIPNHIVPFNFSSDHLKCVKCPLNFASFKNLSEHMYDVHYKNYECPVCRRGFVNVRSLKTHCIAHGINIFPCTYCMKIFDSRTEMEEHEKFHLKRSKVTKKTSTDEKLRKNRNDKFAYITKSSIPDERQASITIKGTIYDSEHKNSSKVSIEKLKTVQIVADDFQSFDSSKANKCKSCPKIFESRSDLLYHINLLHKPHKCGVCGSTFDFQFKLKKHVLKEHPALTYKCSKCPKKYLSGNLLEEHVLEAHEDKEYSCEVCCCQFSNEDDYMAHMKNNHGLE